MRLNVNPQRFNRRRHVADRWVVRKDGADLYAGTRSAPVFPLIYADPYVVVLLNGRCVWPPVDELPLNGGHL